MRSEDDRAVPCDLVLVQGSAIVNEAMLTGESTPQLKESIADREPDATLDIVVKDKNHMLFAGTKVVQSSLPATLPGRLSSRTSPREILMDRFNHADAVDDGGWRTTAPDGGAVAYVLRTGFDTSQACTLCPLHPPRAARRTDPWQCCCPGVVAGQACAHDSLLDRAHHGQQPGIALLHPVPAHVCDCCRRLRLDSW